MKSTLRVVGALALVLAMLLVLSAMTVSAQGPTGTATPTATTAPGGGATPAQAPPAAAAGTNLDNPGIAATIGSAVSAIPANTAQWLRFDYTTPINDFPRNQVMIRMINGVTNGLGFEVWSPERMAGNWWENEPVGRGTQEVLPNCTVTLSDGTTQKCTTNDLTWVGGFGVSGPYYVRVINNTSNPVAPQLIFSGSGLAQCSTGQAPAQPAAQGTNQGFAEVVCDAAALPTVVAQAQAGAAGATPAGPAAAPTVAATETPAAAPTVAATETPAAAASPAASPTTEATATTAATATTEATSTPAAVATSAATSAASGATAVATSAAGAATSVATEAATSAATPTTEATSSPAAAATSASTETPAASGTSPAGAPSVTPGASGGATGGTTLTGLAVAQNAKLGPIVTDSNGRTLYAFTNDTSSTSTCTGSCAQTWPPALASGTPQGGSGVTASMIGTSARSDGGTQVTYNGHPLYYFSGDSAPGDTNGQGVAGKWFTVSPDGTLNQGGGAGGASTPGASGTSAPSGGATSMPSGTATP